MPFVTPYERSPLLQQLLQQNILQSGGPQSRVGSLASILAAVLAAKGLSDENKAQGAQTDKLAQVMADTMQPGQARIPLEGFGDVPSTVLTPEANTSIGRTKEAANQRLKDTLMSMGASNPELLPSLQAQLMLKQWGGQEPDKPIKLGVNEQLLNPKDFSVLAENKKPTSAEEDKFDTYNVAYPGQDPIGVIQAKGPDGKYGVFYPGSNGGPDFNRPVQPGYQKVSTGLEASDVSGLSSRQKDELISVREGAMNALGLSNQLRDQLKTNPNIGLVGFAVQSVDTVGAQLKQLSGMLSGTPQLGGKSTTLDALANPSNYGDIFDRFGPEAAKSQQFKTGITQLAILNAIAHNHNRAPTDGDVKRELTSLSAGSGSSVQIGSALDEMDSITRMQAKNAYVARGKEPPPEFNAPAQTGYDPMQIPGFSKLPPEAQQELLQRWNKLTPAEQQKLLAQ